MWRKAWVETRWWIVLMLVLDIGIASLLLDSPAEAWHGLLGGAVPLGAVVNAIIVAGTGLGTRTSYRPLVAIDPSMLFTLSLPITRRRLVLTRVAVGLLGMTALVGLTLLAYRLFAPGVGATVPAGAYLGYGMAVWSVAAVGFGLSTLCSAWLDQLWQVYATMGVMFAALFGWPAVQIWQPVLNGKAGGPTALGAVIALVLAGLLIEGAVRSVQRRDL
ncbi:MAG: hypothetical protein KF785_15895 [Gemmatimonadales bacterium]|nr:hypothetical protein [Gemmatimonadales bacterium]